MSLWASGKIRPIVLTAQHAESSVRLELRLDSDLFQFQGHFPDHPVLPGVAQLDWAVHFAKEYLDLSYSVREVSKLKFRQLVVPEKPIELRLEYVPQKSCVMFDYKDAKGKPCSSGIIHLDLIE